MFLRRRAIVTRTDEDLVRLLREGHRSALGDLWDRYSELLYGVGMKYLRDPERSKDEVVELFAGLKELMMKHEVERFRPWIHTVMRNRCLQLLRRERPTTAFVDDPGADAADLEEKALHEATLQRLEHAIASLNEEQQRCIRLFHLEGHSYAQVAAICGSPIEQVRSHLQNGRRNLRLILQRDAS
ncbi:MAG TPA: sigma-70 family RNA polymerase sigma factor [Flavobacteriales bacterium]|nr:sigma-70 family RNA polymerase sigma factor [Flavobacteriales bacterium]